jgi:2-amino-4-hydroxy-6-hydroxymethyldihydropteridine diphosphokinase
MNSEKLYLSLGSNMGNKLENLLDAVQALRECVLDAPVVVSGVYQTEPIGNTAQDDFLNLVIAGKPRLNPEETLAACLEIEKKMGRVRTVHWGPRIIDIDILLYGRRQIKTETLEIPHPRLQERAFVLVPLREVDTPCFNRLQVQIPSQKVNLLFSANDVKIKLDKRDPQ